MKKHPYFRNIALAIVLGIALTVCSIVRAFVPMAVLPKLDIPNMVLLSLVALLLDHYLFPGVRRMDLVAPLLGALTFGLLPYAAGFCVLLEALKLAMIGGVIFTASAWVFAEVQERLSSGPAAKAAPIFSALGLYLAAQCFAGILL